MADEIIKLIEYITNNGVFKGAIIAYGLFALLVIAIVIGVFIFVFKQFKRLRK